MLKTVPCPNKYYCISYYYLFTLGTLVEVGWLRCQNSEIGSHKFVQNIIWLPIMYLVWWGILKKQEMSSVPKSVQADCQYVGPSVVERA